MNKIIAMVFDSDYTLTPEYMQVPIFNEYGVNDKEFWKENEQFKERTEKQGIRLQPEISYLNQILRYTKKGVFKDLSNRKLRELGKKIEFYKGIPEFFDNLRKTARTHDYEMEYYVITSGLTEMLKGSAIAPYIKEVYGCEFIEENGIISELAQVVSYTEKTRFLFEINKGTRRVNDKIPIENRRVPFTNMIYVADGVSDVPAFEVLKDKGGHTYAVHEKDTTNAKRLLSEKRVHNCGPADYTKGSETYNKLEEIIQSICHKA